MERKAKESSFLFALLLLLFIFQIGSKNFHQDRVIKPSEFFPNDHWKLKPRPKNYNPPPYEYYGTEPIEDPELLV